jgi:predicted CxxxxCH...CXXCH cytochrome family protein
MSKESTLGRWCVFFVVCSAAVAIAAGVWLQRASAADAGQPQPAEIVQPYSNVFMSLNRRFEGSQTCGGSNCHSAAQEEPAPARMANQLPIWNDQDKHSKSFQALKNDASKAIAQKLNIADAATSAKCLGCHTIGAPQPLHGKQFDIAEGVTCNGCHGPSNDWNAPHVEVGWTQKMRQQARGNAQQLLANTGLYDTKDITARADMCTSCHLAIDAEMVVAGHPQPRFELAAYSSSLPPHWRDVERYLGVKAWASGQAACTRDAMKQLAARAASGANDASISDAYNQAMAHYNMLVLLGQSAGVDVSALTAASQPLATIPADKQQLAQAARDVAEKAAALAAPVKQLAPNKEIALKLLKTIAANDAIYKIGAPPAGAAGPKIAFGQSQQSLALSSIFGAYAAMENVPQATSDDVFGVIGTLFPPETASSIETSAFEAGLKNVQAKVNGLQ